MANILGIIAEYNPLHNGHLYHIETARERTKADYVVAIITGNFTQRGNPSIMNKWEKARMALETQVDLIVELPTVYSISSAENFANGAIKIFKQLNVNYISFGMELDSISELNRIADILAKEPEEYRNILKMELKEGYSFPRARQNALVKYTGNDDYEEILKGPNNILAIEYIKAIKKQKVNIMPIGITREKVFYNSKKVVDEYASSTGIRSLLKNKKVDEITRVVPSSTFSILIDNIENGTYIPDLKAFESTIIYKLRMMNKSEISNLPEVYEGLENLIKSSAEKTNDIDKLIEMIKSKRYTQTKIQRILLYSLIEITKQDMMMSYKLQPYIRVLGFNNKGKRMLSWVSTKSIMITSVKKFEDTNNSRRHRRLLEIDKRATDIYTIGYKKNSESNLDYTMGVILK